MKIIFVFLIFWTSVIQLYSQEQVLLPKEIKTKDYTIRYGYDLQNRITSITKEDGGSVKVDSIDYIGDTVAGQFIKRHVVVYKYEGDKQKVAFPAEGIKYSYLKKKENTDRLVCEEYNNTELYLIGSDGRLDIKQTENSKGNDRILKFEYNKKGNLSKLIHLKGEGTYLSASVEEKELIYAELAYDERKGIYSHVNPESFWLLSSEVEKFYPYFHLSNNVSKIRGKQQDEGGEDDEVTARFGTVDYTYAYNSKNYPKKMVQHIVDIYGKEKSCTYTITYQKASLLREVQSIPNAKPVAGTSEIKLLPEKIYAPGFNLSYTYDKKNRITSVQCNVEDKIIQKDTLIYDPSEMGVSMYSLVDSLSDSIYYRFISRKGNVIEADTGDGIIVLTFSPSGKLERMVMKDRDYDESSDYPPVIIGFVYDANGNLVDMDLPNNASGDRVNRNLQMLEYWDMRYDNRNGIYKNVSHDSFPVLFSQKSLLPCYYFFGNNLTALVDGDEIITQLSYIYNKEGYPSRMKTTSEQGYLNISYIEGH